MKSTTEYREGCSKNSGLEQFSQLLSRQNEGLSKEERESRLEALERIANLVRARRSTSSTSHSTPAIPGKDRIPA
jgi:hypothetical protein